MATIPHEMRFQCQKLMVFTSSVATLSHDGGSPFARNEVRASKTVGGSNPSVRKDVRVSKIRCFCAISFLRRQPSHEMRLECQKLFCV